MSAAKRIKEITIEIERLSVIRKPKNSACFCIRCDKVSNLVSFREAFQITHLTKEELSLRIEQGEIHVIIDPLLNPMLCIRSLMSEADTLQNFRIG